MQCVTVWRGWVSNNAARLKSRGHQHHIFDGWYDERGAVVAVYRLAADGALAIRVSAGAILTSTSLTGFSVQAWVT
jgi:hypothetical protein